MEHYGDNDKAILAREYASEPYKNARNQQQPSQMNMSSSEDNTDNLQAKNSMHR